ncbi:MAG: arsenate reductase/protein-tyrosine-phosphatase family protein [Acidimicrobiales bacterium]
MCSGNIYRSPMAHGYLAQLARRQDLAVEVESAGTYPGTRRIADEAVRAMGEAALGMEERISRPLDAGEVAAMDLVLAMAREHVREAVILHPPAWPRAYTLKELVRRGEEVGPRPEESSLDEWLELVGAGRSRAELLGASDSDDVADPNGEPLSVVRDTYREIADLVDRMVALVRPGRRSP